jgi:hypothetical protein
MEALPEGAMITDDFTTDQYLMDLYAEVRKRKLAAQQQPGLFPSWKHVMLAFLLLSSPWIGYVVWKLTR